VRLSGPADRVDGEYLEGRRVGTWVWREPRGAQQLTSNPDTAQPRTEDFEGRQVIAVNGVQVTTYGDEPRERFESDGAILRLTNVLQPQTSGPRTQRLVFRVIESQARDNLTIVCATLEEPKNFGVEQLFVGAIRHTPEGDPHCGGFVDVLGRPETSVDAAKTELDALRAISTLELGASRADLQPAVLTGYFGNPPPARPPREVPQALVSQVE
jgi:hypothetical protein